MFYFSILVQGALLQTMSKGVGCKYLAASPCVVDLTCKSGSSGPGSDAVVLSASARREGVSVIRVTLASAKAGTNRRGSAATPSGKMARGTPAKSGVSSSATKSTKHEGVRLR